MLTVPEAARRALKSLRAFRGRIRGSDTVHLPPEWRETFWGGPMPDLVGIIRRQRAEH
jgi:hypothetical protein